MTNQELRILEAIEKLKQKLENIELKRRNRNVC